MIGSPSSVSSFNAISPTVVSQHRFESILADGHLLRSLKKGGYSQNIRVFGDVHPTFCQNSLLVILQDSCFNQPTPTPIPTAGGKAWS